MKVPWLASVSLTARRSPTDWRRNQLNPSRSWWEISFLRTSALVWNWSHPAPVRRSTIPAAFHTATAKIASTTGRTRPEGEAPSSSTGMMS